MEQSKVDFEKLADVQEKYGINLDEEIKTAPITLSIGEHQDGQQMKPTPFATEGNFSVVSGMGKSKKSFFKSLLVAGYIGGRTIEYAPDLKSHRTEDKAIIDFDTEQSRYHAQKVFKRTEQLVGSRYKKYYPFALRQATHHERIEAIDLILRLQGNIGLIIIDGLADLVSDVNDLKECNEVIQKLMEWSDKTQAHIIVIIHTNFDKNGEGKQTGHLGSALRKKAETLCVLTAVPDSNISKVKFTMTRGRAIDELELEINYFTSLPYLKKGIPTETPKLFK